MGSGSAATARVSFAIACRRASVSSMRSMNAAMIPFARPRSTSGPLTARMRGVSVAMASAMRRSASFFCVVLTADIRRLAARASFALRVASDSAVSVARSIVVVIERSSA